MSTHELPAARHEQGEGSPARRRLTITVHGTPAPQGSKRSVLHSKTRRVVTFESGHDRVQTWREAVKKAAIDWRFIETTLEMLPALEGPLCVEVTFTLRKPLSAPKTRTTWPAKKPDVDKLLRSTFDALSDAGLWRDDAQVVEVTARKVYPSEGIDALDHPGAVIRIWEVAP